MRVSNRGHWIKVLYEQNDYIIKVGPLRSSMISTSFILLCLVVYPLLYIFIYSLCVLMFPWQDSYVLRYFEAQVQYLSVGPPVYFVVRDGHNYTDMMGQNVICDRAGCDEFSLLGQVFSASQQPYRSVCQLLSFCNAVLSPSCNDLVIILSLSYHRLVTISLPSCRCVVTILSSP